MKETAENSVAPTSSTKATEAKGLQLEKKMSRVYILILSFFVCTYFPSIVMTYILHFCHSCGCTLRHVLRDLAFLLICTNSCVNPIIYALRLGTFRASLKLICCTTGSKYASTSTSSCRKSSKTLEINEDGGVGNKPMFAVCHWWCGLIHIFSDFWRQIFWFLDWNKKMEKIQFQ